MANRWIRSRLGATISAVERAFDDYRFDFAASALYDFTWHEYCDWYIEIVKPVLQDASDPAAQHAARRTLLQVLEALLRALHPLMPFISEDIWLRVAPLVGAGGPSVMLAPWPQAAQFEHDAAAETELRWVMQLVLAIRQIRGQMDISPARRLPLLLQHASASDLQLAQRHHALLSRLAGLESVRPLAAGDTAPPAAAALVGELSLLVPMAGLIEPVSELQRLDKRRQKIEQELTKSRAKLANQSFVNSAPADVVAQERARLAERESERAALLRQIEQVRALPREGV